MFSLLVQEGKEVFSILALVFMPRSPHGIILGVDTFQSQCHAVNSAEQLCEICSTILEEGNSLYLFLDHKMSTFLTAQE